MGEFEVNISNGCIYDFDTGTEVTLTATANTDSVFAGWSEEVQHQAATGHKAAHSTLPMILRSQQHLPNPPFPVKRARSVPSSL